MGGSEGWWVWGVRGLVGVGGLRVGGCGGSEGWWVWGGSEGGWLWGGLRVGGCGGSEGWWVWVYA